MLVLQGAYGRQYKTAKAVKADWADGKDFSIATVGQRGYINKQDADGAGMTVQIRFAMDRKFTVIAAA